MHPQQKAAWFILIVSAATLALYVAGVPILSWYFGKPWSVVAGPATGLLGIFGFTGFARVFYIHGRNDQPLMDERDRILSSKIWRAGMATFWLIFITACMGSWSFLRYVRGMDRITMPVDFIPILAALGFIIATVAQALATLHYYGWKAGHDAQQ